MRYCARDVHKYPDLHALISRRESADSIGRAQLPLMSDEFVTAMIRLNYDIHRRRFSSGIDESPLTSAEVAEAFEEIQRLRALVKELNNMMRDLDRNNKKKGQ